VDVTKTQDLKEKFKQVADWKGRLDGLVAAAGIQYEAPALEYTAEDCRRILDVNVLSISSMELMRRSLGCFFVPRQPQSK